MLVNAMRSGYVEALAGFSGWQYKRADGTIVTYDRKNHNQYGYDLLGRINDSSITPIFLTSVPTSSWSANIGICVGNDDTAPNENDYTISAVGNVFSASITVSVTATTISYIITLTATSAVTISEIGLFIALIGSPGYSSYGQGVLVARDTFTPVTFAVGDAKTITYTFTKST